NATPQVAANRHPKAVAVLYKKLGSRAVTQDLLAIDRLADNMVSISAPDNSAPIVTDNAGKAAHHVDHVCVDAPGDRLSMVHGIDVPEHGARQALEFKGLADGPHGVRMRVTDERGPEGVIPNLPIGPRSRRLKQWQTDAIAQISSSRRMSMR